MDRSRPSKNRMVRVILVRHDEPERDAIQAPKRAPLGLTSVHDPLGLQYVNRGGHVCLEPGKKTGCRMRGRLVPDDRDVLAGETAAEDIQRRNVPPANLRDAAAVQVWGQWHTKTLAMCSLISETRDCLGVECLRDGAVVSAISGEQ